MKARALLLAALIAASGGALAASGDASVGKKKAAPCAACQQSSSSGRPTVSNDLGGACPARAAAIPSGELSQPGTSRRIGA